MFADALEAKRLPVFEGRADPESTAIDDPAPAGAAFDHAGQVAGPRGKELRHRRRQVGTPILVQHARHTDLTQHDKSFLFLFYWWMAEGCH